MQVNCTYPFNFINSGIFSLHQVRIHQLLKWLNNFTYRLYSCLNEILLMGQIKLWIMSIHLFAHSFHCDLFQICTLQNFLNVCLDFIILKSLKWTHYYMSISHTFHKLKILSCASSSKYNNTIWTWLESYKIWSFIFPNLYLMTTVSKMSSIFPQSLLFDSVLPTFKALEYHHRYNAHTHRRGCLCLFWKRLIFRWRVFTFATRFPLLWSGFLFSFFVWSLLSSNFLCSCFLCICCCSLTTLLLRFRLLNRSEDRSC